MAQVGQYNWPDYIEGSLFKSETVALVCDGAPVDLTDAKVEMEFKRKGCDDVALTLSIGSGLAVETPTNGIITVGGIALDLKPGSYLYFLSVSEAIDAQADPPTFHPPQYYLKGTIDVLSV